MPNFILAAFFYLFLLSIALLLGLMIPIVNIKLTIVFFATLVGSVLIFQPKQLMWLTLLMTLLFAGLVKFFVPGMDRVWWIAYGLAFLFLITVLPQIIAYFLSFKANKTNMTMFMFALSVLISLIYNAGTISVMQLVTVFKSVIMFSGVWLVIRFYPFSRKDMRYYLHGMLAIASIQIIPALYQYIFVRDEKLRRGIGDTVEASDSVVGTFGGSFEGGGLTAVLAFYLIMTIAFLIAFKRKKIISTGYFVLFLLLSSIPLLLVEVKAIFIYLPVVFIFLFRDKIFKNIGYAILSGILLTGILAILLIAYQNLHWSGKSTDIKSNSLSSFSYSFKSRLSGNINSIAYFDGKLVLSRKETIDLWLGQQNSSTVFNTLFGYGPAASKLGTISQGSIAKKFSPLLVDKMAVSLFLWDYGLVGTFLIFFIIYTYYLKAINVYRDTTDKELGAIALALSATIPLFALAMLYRNDIPNAAPMMFILMFSFGLTDWLNKQHKLMLLDMEINNNVIK